MEKCIVNQIVCGKGSQMHLSSYLHTHTQIIMYIEYDTHMR